MCLVNIEILHRHWRETESVVDIVLANGSDTNVLLDILTGEEIGTLFVAKAKIEMRAKNE